MTRTMQRAERRSRERVRCASPLRWSGPGGGGCGRLVEVSAAGATVVVGADEASRLPECVRLDVWLTNQMEWRLADAARVLDVGPARGGECRVRVQIERRG